MKAPHDLPAREVPDNDPVGADLRGARLLSAQRHDAQRVRPLEPARVHELAVSGRQCFGDRRLRPVREEVGGEAREPIAAQDELSGRAYVDAGLFAPGGAPRPTGAVARCRGHLVAARAGTRPR